MPRERGVSMTRAWRRALTLVGLLAAACCAPASMARADVVVLLPPVGQADDLRRADLEEALTVALRAAGHTLVVGDAIRRGALVGEPRTADELVALAQGNGATWTLVSEAHPLRGQYRLLLRAGYAPLRRVEELDVLVLHADEAARLRDILGSLVRPAGLGEDALRLTGGEDAAAIEQREREARAQAEREEEARARAERERTEREQAERDRAATEAAQARAEFERREAERAQAERDRLAAEFDARERYADDAEHPWLAQLSLGGAGLMAYPDPPGPSPGGGFLGSFGARVGYALPKVARGLELRGGLEAVFGVASALELFAGAAWLASPFSFPLHIGGSAELGGFFNTSSAREPGFLLRASAVASWRPAPRLYVEAAFPTLNVISSAGGLVSLGGAARIGYRF
jgi:hypothetical protein